MRGPSRCGMKQPYTPRHPGLSDALHAYEICGFDTAAIRQWCIPELDAEMLVDATLRQRPKRILEVGTYVGVSTLLLALATDADSTIVTIDPNLPLGTEMGSMQSDLGGLDGTARTHDVARAAARQLGVDQRIHFIEGGFATGDTFSSSRQDPAARVAVVGPASCAEFGPFDLVFIDGLHYAAAVEADLRLAATALAPGGLILMHDCIGMWGTNVRAGIFRFLAAHPEFRVVHPTFVELYRSVGTVFRAGDRPDLLGKFRTSEPHVDVVQAAIGSMVSSTIRRLEPALVVELAAGGAVVTPLIEAAGVPTVTVEVPIRADLQALDAQLRKIDAAWRVAGSCDRMLMSVGLIDHLPGEALHYLFDWLRERDGLGVFAFTPPGEVGVAGSNSRSFAQLVQLLGETGLAAATWSRLAADPIEFAFAMGKPGIATTSFCANTALVGGATRIAKIARSLRPNMITLGVSEAEAFEQETLLRLHYSRGFAWMFAELGRIRTRLSEQEGEAEDLRRQIREQIGRGDDLVRQILDYQAALAERDATNADVRRQLTEQVARSEDLVRQVEERDRAGVELRRHVIEQVARSESLALEVEEHRAALDERKLADADLRRQLIEQVSRSESLAREVEEHRMALGEREHADVDLRRQLVEQVARSDDLAQQALQYRDALAPRDGTEKDLRRQLAEQVARSEDLIRQVLDYQAALEIADRRTESPETISQ